MLVQITPEQRDLLLTLLDEAVEELAPEIHHTRSAEYKETLKTRRNQLTAAREALAAINLEVPPEYRESATPLPQ